MEAAWKYVVICSTGIALALLGLLLLNAAAAHAGVPAGLDWARLVSAAPHLDAGVTRIAVALLIVGFGTKAGLAPLHAWLPDAHGQAPAPVSALMSGVLLSVAFYAILRVKAIADLALGAGFARTLLVVLALASLLLAASLLIRQRDYKRMLAYSSIEHMGLIALGAAVGGPLALAAVLLHMLGHGLVKGSLFVSARTHPAGDRHQPHRRDQRARPAAPAAGRLRRGGGARHGRVPAVQRLRQRDRHRPGRLQRRPRLGDGARPGPDAGDHGRAFRPHRPHAARRRRRRRPPHGTAARNGAGAPATETARGHAAGLAPVIAALAACAVLGIYAGPLAVLLRSAALSLTGAS